MINGAKHLRERAQHGEFTLGFAVTLTDSIISEMAASAGFDFVFIDAEHTPMDRQNILHHTMAAQGAGASVLVRVHGADPHWLKGILDFGPDGIIFPFVHSGEIAKQCVASCMYPDNPWGGIRGQGPQRAVRWGMGAVQDYLKNPHEYLIKIMQIESYEGWKNLDDILSTPGVDGIYLGPADLSRSLKAQGDASIPPLAQVCQDICQRVRQAGKWLGMPLSGSPDGIVTAIEKGAQWGVCGIDTEILASEMKQTVNAWANNSH